MNVKCYSSSVISYFSLLFVSFLFPLISCFSIVINLFILLEKCLRIPEKPKVLFMKPNFSETRKPRVFSLFCNVTLLSRPY